MEIHKRKSYPLRYAERFKWLNKCDDDDNDNNNGDKDL